MNGRKARLNGGGSLSPVLLELTVVVLFFALCASITVQALAAASSLSDESAQEGRAAIALSDFAERILLDPEAAGTFDEAGCCTLTRQDGELTLTAAITREPRRTGAYYAIELSAVGAGGEVAAMTAGRYLREVSAS